MLFRKTVLKNALIAFLFLSLMGGAQSVSPERIRATQGQGYYDGTVEHENPFPDIFSLEEIENAGGGEIPFIYKYRLTPQGQAPFIYDPEQGDPTEKKALDKVCGLLMEKGTKMEVFVVILPSRYTGVRFDLGGMSEPGFSATPIRARNGDPAQGLQRMDSVEQLWKNMELNGEPLQFIPNQYPSFTPDSTEFAFDQVSYPQYLRFECEMQEPTSEIHQAFGVTEVREHHVKIERMWTFVSSKFGASAQFHFVDEFAYRKARKLQIGEAVSQRSAGTPAFSSAAFSSYPLKDLVDAQMTRAPFVLRERDTSDTKFPLLRPAGEKSYAFMDAENRGTHYQFDDIALPRVQNVLKPSLSELKERVIPGYVFAATDIDLPPREDDFQENDQTCTIDGNHYISVSIDAQGRALREKHYYLLQRPIVAPVTVLVRDEADPDRRLEGAQFTVEVQDFDGSYRRIPGTFETDERGEIAWAKSPVTLEELETWTRGDSQNLGYVREGDQLYLYPGLTYRLTEIATPEGYQKGEAVEFVVSNQALSVAHSDEGKQVQVPAQIVTVTNASYEGPRSFLGAKPEPDPNLNPNPSAPSVLEKPGFVKSLVPIHSKFSAISSKLSKDAVPNTGAATPVQ